MMMASKSADEPSRKVTALPSTRSIQGRQAIRASATKFKKMWAAGNAGSADVRIGCRGTVPGRVPRVLVEKGELMCCILCRRPRLVGQGALSGQRIAFQRRAGDHSGQHPPLPPVRHRHATGAEHGQITGDF